MTINTPPEWLAGDARTEIQRRRVCAAAAQVMNYCGELIPKPLKGEMFAFASNMLLKASEVEAEEPDKVTEFAMAQNVVKPLTELTQTEHDMEIDEASQSMLKRLSSGTMTTEIVGYARKGADYATILTTYPIRLGSWAFDVVRMRPLNDPDGTISYTIHPEVILDDNPNN